MVKPKQVKWRGRVKDVTLFPVLIPKLGAAVEVVAAGPVLVVPVHWHEDTRKTLPCPGPENGCAKCHWWMPREQGYLPSWLGNGKRVAVQVTEGSIRAAPELQTPDCVGVWYRFERRGKKCNSSLFAVRLDRERQLDCPDCHDIKPTLYHMWGLSD